MIGGSTALVE